MSAQGKLYQGISRLFFTYGTGGATWTRTRGSGGTPATDPTLTQASGISLRFLENNRIVERTALPQTPIWTAPWWGLAGAGVDVQAEDVYDNGSIAFRVTGTPDTSQSIFILIPAERCGVPQSLSAGLGYRSPLFILGL